MNAAIFQPCPKFHQVRRLAGNLHILNALHQTQAIQMQKDVLSKGCVKLLLIGPQVIKTLTKLRNRASLVYDAISLQAQFAIVGELRPISAACLVAVGLTVSSGLISACMKRKILRKNGCL